MSASQADRILVFIPAYRCAAQLERVIAQFDQDVQRQIDTVVVIDNRSPDDTLARAIARAQTQFTHCHFVAVRNNDNYGLGGSHKAAFAYAIKHGFTHLVVLHGDDQADIHDLLPVLAAGRHREVDCLLGARFMRGSRLIGYSAFRTIGNGAFNLLFSAAVGDMVHDLGSGLNLYRLDAFTTPYFNQFPDDLTFNYLMLLASYQRRQRIAYFPISWREEDQQSNVRIVSQSIKVLGLLGRFVFQPKRLFGSDWRSVARENYDGTVIDTVSARQGVS